jgi:hypothetical protein
MVLERLKFLRAGGTAVFDDLRPQNLSVRHTSGFPRVFGCISIQRKNRFDTGKEFFNRIDLKQPSVTASLWGIEINASKPGGAVKA